MKKIRLLIDAHVFDGEFQGSRTFIENIYKRLIKFYSDGIEFYFAAHNTGTLKSVFGEAENIYFVQLRSTNKYSRLLQEFPSIIKSHNIDYAHFQYVAPPLKSCKFLLTTHDVLFERFPQYFPLSYRLSKHFLFRYSAKKADILTTVSRFSRDEIAHFYSIPKEEIHVIPNGVESDVPAGKAPVPKPYILYISRIEPRKNHHLLISAMMDLGLFEKGYKLVLIGKESIPNRELDTLISGSAAKFRKQINFLEGVTEFEKNSLLKHCSLFVYPSSAEGFGIPPLEAALQKVPVICSNQTAMADFEFFGKGHINPENYEELKKAIEEFIENPDLENRQGIYNEVLKNYTWEKSAHDLARLIIKRQ